MYIFHDVTKCSNAFSMHDFCSLTQLRTNTPHGFWLPNEIDLSMSTQNASQFTFRHEFNIPLGIVIAKEFNFSYCWWIDSIFTVIGLFGLPFGWKMWSIMKSVSTPWFPSNAWLTSLLTATKHESNLCNDHSSLSGNKHQMDSKGTHTQQPAIWEWLVSDLLTCAAAKKALQQPGNSGQRCYRRCCRGSSDFLASPTGQREKERPIAFHCWTYGQARENVRCSAGGWAGRPFFHLSLSTQMFRKKKLPPEFCSHFSQSFELPFQPEFWAATVLSTVGKDR